MSKNNQHLDIPPIDLRYKIVKGFFGGKKKVKTSKKEQRELKKRYLARNPNLNFIDDLHDKNSVKVDDLGWIDEIETIDAIIED